MTDRRDADTNDFVGGFGGSISELDFGDDELAPAIPGPFGDPRSALTLPEGDYIVDGPATGCADRQVPMPATLLLLGLGVIGSAAFRYGRF